MSALPKRLFTPEEYVLLENQAAYKSQYVAGEIYAMAGAEPWHTQIVRGLILALETQFGDRPDVIALCGEPRYDTSSRPATLLNPQAIFEVLSPSTETFDRGEKFMRYRTLESLTDYVLVASEFMRIEHFVRQENGTWNMTEYQQPQDQIALRSLDCALTLAQVYRRVDFPPRRAGV